MCTFYDLKLAACYSRPLVVKGCAHSTVRSLCAIVFKAGALKVGEISGGLEGTLFKVFNLLQKLRGGMLSTLTSKSCQTRCDAMRYSINLCRGRYSV